MSKNYTTEQTSALVRKLQRSGYTLVGSRSFFTSIPGFNPSDYDFVKVVPKNTRFGYIKHCHVCGICINEVVKRNFKEYLAYLSAHSEMMTPMCICSLFHPNIAKEMDFNFIRDHSYLDSFIERLSNKHQYYRVIYDAYLENGGCFLTDKQREKAYQVYLQAKTQ